MIIAVANHKGGTGKTTTTINLAVALKMAGKKVLMVDTDPQGNLSYSLGITDIKHTITDLIFRKSVIKETIINKNGIDIIPSAPQITDTEYELYRMSNSRVQFAEILSHIKKNYDFILIDCPPTLSILTINSLNAAKGIIIPMQLEVLAIQGLEQLLHTVNELNKLENPELEIIGVLAVQVDERRQLTAEIINHIRDNYDVPIFDTYIRKSVKAAEAPSFGLSVIEYAPTCNTSVDYMKVTEELLNFVTEELNEILTK